jgi:mono/diheme cytochrome c family protein
MRRTLFMITALAVVACGRDGAAGASSQRYGLGRPAQPQEIAALAIDVGPDGAGLPPGHGNVADGEKVYAAKCASCHGAKGEGIAPAYPKLIGRDPAAENFAFDTNPKLVKTIGNYWPYATTVFDYVRRAMPLTTPGSLTDDETYALTAYLLAANQVIPMDATLDAKSLAAVKMPYVDRFVRDDRRGGREVK